MVLDRLSAVSMRSLAGSSGRGSTWSIRSWFSTASIASVGSVGSIQSVASAGSVLSIGSAGSILSIGSAGSILSVGSAGSILSVASAGSILSIRSQGSILCVDDRPVGPRSPEIRTGIGATVGVGAILLVIRMVARVGPGLQSR